ncbi:hypothetical protein PE066_06565 [Ramlibacter tataouinensis]|uniref:hypothetical protein n=1 Tax=Ramlibacter tataouinensis TaxID=94132 RepID=UPI0022F3A34B|nr:hypothetical protein [Ramlibacter tataouinensis]WBY03191.1 hypothetical protein PE066_06565 [Ramlibacter tataouinensis]
MRILAIPVSLLALALLAGCAQMRSGTSTMGASRPATNVMCRDGAWVSSTSQCGDHMGVERVMGTTDTPK